MTTETTSTISSGVVGGEDIGAAYREIADATSSPSRSRSAIQSRSEAGGPSRSG